MVGVEPTRLGTGKRLGARLFVRALCWPVLITGLFLRRCLMEGHSLPRGSQASIGRSATWDLGISERPVALRRR